MSKRLRDLFQASHQEGRALFIPYLTGGYPTPGETVSLLLAMEAGGADVIEVGVPFTDPLADGATIQHANHVAVQQHVTFEQCMGFVREARAHGLRAPVLFMGYYNPVLALGEERTVALAKAAGADGFIIVDLPPEEAGPFLAACRSHDMSFIPLVAQTTSDARIAKLAAVADAFLYCVSVTGTTGQRAAMPTDLGDFLARIRKQTDLPLAVGFGISTREHVVTVGKIADAAIVGSAVIGTIDAGDGSSRPERLRDFVKEMTGR
ncbi:MAG TPA: tryptophan synthase subunit alpha [Tepidiformaceae bacterium]|jgi:tryptophan synthase